MMHKIDTQLLCRHLGCHNPILPRLWRRGHAPHWLGVWVLEAQSIPRAVELANPRGLVGPGGRGSRCGASVLGTLPAVPVMIPGAEGPALRPQQGRPHVEVTTIQPRTPQAHAAMGRLVHHRGSLKARHLQASERKRRCLRQRLEHPAATSLLSLKFQVVCTYFVLIS